MDENDTENLQATVSLRSVLAVLDEYEAHYPTDVFPEKGTSPDCAGARFARTVIRGIRHDIREQANVVLNDSGPSAGASPQNEVGEKT